MDERNEEEKRIHSVNPNYFMEQTEEPERASEESTETSEQQERAEQTQDTQAQETVNIAEPERRYAAAHIPTSEPSRSNSVLSKSVGVLVAVASLIVIIAGMLLIGELLGSNDPTGDVAAGTSEPSPEQDETVGTATLTKDDSDDEDMEGTYLDVSDIVEGVMPTVVAVTSTFQYKPSYSIFGNDEMREDVGSGSGVIIAQNEEELLIVTNAHVIEAEKYSNYTLQSASYTITFADDAQVEAYTRGVDEELDLAVIAVKLEKISSETKKVIKVATVGDSDALKVGNGVIAIGNALGYGQSMTVGYVSALNREVSFADGYTRVLLQTDAAINPGNSGGGLFDMKGRLVGINSAKIADKDIEGIGYAIPISSVEEVITELMNTVARQPVTDENKKAALGVQCSSYYQDMYEGQGAFITDVVEGSAADQAGIMAYDIITGIDGHKITSWDDLLEEISYYEGGTTVTISYMTLEESGGRRQYVERETQLTFGYYKDLDIPTEE